MIDNEKTLDVKSLNRKIGVDFSKRNNYEFER